MDTFFVTFRDLVPRIRRKDSEEIIKLRKQDQEERDERESMLDLYLRAMEQAGSEKVAKAA